MQIKENIKAPRHWPLWPVNSPNKWSVTREMFPLMTSSRVLLSSCQWSNFRGAVQYMISTRSLLKLKSRETSFVHNIRFNYRIVLKFCNEQCHCRALCNISKRLANWVISYGQTSLHECLVNLRCISDRYRIIHSPSKDADKIDFYLNQKTHKARTMCILVG